MWIYIIIYFTVNGSNLTPESCRQFKNRELAVFWVGMDNSYFRQEKEPYTALLDSVWVNKSIKDGDVIRLKKSNHKILYKSRNSFQYIKKSINKPLKD